VAIMSQYQAVGLILSKADNSVEAGLYKTWMALSSGKLKVFESLLPWFDEYRLYRRDEKGKIVKERDHLMDCTRYFMMSGIAVAAYQPVAGAEPLNMAIMDYDPLVGPESARRVGANYGPYGRVGGVPWNQLGGRPARADTEYDRLKGY